MMTCRDLCVGALRHRVALQRATLTSDGMGGQSVAWQQYASMRAHMEVKTAMERGMHDRLEAMQRIIAYMRYRSDIQERDRLIFQGRAYQIRGIKDVEFRKLWLELDLESGVAT